MDILSLFFLLLSPFLFFIPERPLIPDTETLNVSVVHYLKYIVRSPSLLFTFFSLLLFNLSLIKLLAFFCKDGHVKKDLMALESLMEDMKRTPSISLASKPKPMKVDIFFLSLFPFYIYTIYIDHVRPVSCFFLLL